MKRVERTIVVVEIAKGVNIKIARSAVAQIIRDKPKHGRRLREPARVRALALEIEEESMRDRKSLTESADEEADRGRGSHGADETGADEGTARRLPGARGRRVLVLPRPVADDCIVER